MRPLSAGLILAILLGCGASTANRPVVDDAPTDGIPIEVENGTGTPLRVFVRVGTNEWPLGRVDALRSVRLSLPGGVRGNMALAVRPTASRQFGEQHVSEGFSVEVGQRVVWELRAPIGANVPRISNVYIYACETEAC